MKKVLISALIAISSLSFAQSSAHQFIPKDASMVFSFNSAVTLSKINLKEIKELEVFQDMLKSMKHGAREDSNVVETLWNKSKKYGITLNPSSQLYVDFREGEYGPRPMVGLITPLKTGKKFEKLMKVILKEEFADFVETDGIYKYYYKKEMAIAWSKTYAILLFVDNKKPDEMIEEMKAVLNTAPDSSMLVNNSFLAATDGKSDIEVYFNTTKLFDLNKGMSRLINPAALAELRGNESFYSLDFMDGLINVQAHSPIASDDLAALKDITDVEVNPELMKWVDNNAPVCLWNNSSIFKAKNYLLENHPEIADSITAMAERYITNERISEDSSISEIKDQMWADTTTWEQRKVLREIREAREDSLHAIYDSTAKEYIAEKLGKYELKEEDIWKLFKGDLYASIYGTTERIDTFTTYEFTTDEDGEYKYLEVEKTRIEKDPVYKVLASSDAPEKLQRILEILVEDSILTQPDKEKYFVGKEGKQSTYIAVSEGILLFTNDETFMRDFLNGVPPKEASEAGELIDLDGELVDFQTLIQRRNFSTHVNFELLLDMLADENMAQVYDEFKGLLSSFNASGHITDQHEFSSQLRLKGNRNALHLIADMVNGMYLMYSSNMGH